MKAYVLQHGKLKLVNMKEPSVGAQQVKIRLKAVGLNHRDLKIKDRYGIKEKPLILGSDGAGVIEELGSNVSRFGMGEEVVINPSLYWYQNSDAPPDNFQIVGMPSHGTFAEKMILSEDFVEQKPAHLNWQEAGVFALSALTGYRALFTKGQISKENTLFIPGVGSGVNTLIILFAKSIGARVITTSRNTNKRKKAERLGVDLVLDTNSDWKDALKNEQVDLVIESIGGATFNKSLDVLKKGGKMVTFGSSSTDEISFDLRNFFYGQYKLYGSTMGSREEFQELLLFTQQLKIKPIIDRSFSFDQIEEAYQRLEAQEQFGKISVTID